jgi:hypothetical protein
VFYEKIPPAPRLDQILKLMATYELYGLNDIAVDIAVTFANELGPRLDVERAIDLLCDNDGGAVREYLAEVRGLKLSLAATRRRVDSLRRELSADLRSSQERLTTRVVEELEEIKAELNSVIATEQELPQPHQFTYDGQAEIDCVIAADPKDVTRDHGAAIMRISPPHATGLAECTSASSSTATVPKQTRSESQCSKTAAITH